MSNKYEIVCDNCSASFKTGEFDGVCYYPIKPQPPLLNCGCAAEARHLCKTCALVVFSEYPEVLKELQEAS